MSLDIATMRKPVTRVNWPTDKTAAELVLLGDFAAPTALDDPNVYPIPLVEKDVLDGKEDTSLQEVEELWQFQWRTDNADSDGSIIIWCYNQWVEQWYPTAKIPIKGTNLLDEDHGGVFTMNGILGCSHIGIQVDDHAGNTLYLLHEWR